MVKYTVDQRFMACDRYRDLRDEGYRKAAAMYHAAAEASCDPCTLRRWLKRKADTGVLSWKKGGGRLPKTTINEDLAMLELARNENDAPFREIVRRVAPQVSTSTVRRRLKIFK